MKRPSRMRRRRLREIALRDALGAFEEAPIVRWADPMRPVPTPRRSRWRDDESLELETDAEFRQYRRYYRRALVAAVRVCILECQSPGYDELRVRALARREATTALRGV